MAHHAHATASRPFFGEPFSGLVKRLRARRDRMRTYAATRAELSRLSDRDLADIGFHRLQIDDVARKVAGRS